TLAAPEPDDRAHDPGTALEPGPATPDRNTMAPDRGPSVEIAAGVAPVPSASAVERARSARDADLKAERALLDGAREAFARGDAAEAIAALDAHAQKFPAGRLVEEREALAIKALVNVGRVEEARRRADRFRARFPKSLLTSAVDNALQMNP